MRKYLADMKKFIYVITLALASLTCYAETESADSISPFTYLGSIEISADSYSLDPCFTIPGLGLFTKVGDGRFRSLDIERSPEISEFMRLENIYYDQTIGMSDRMLVRSGNEIYSIGDSINRIGEFDTHSFRLFAGQDSSFYTVAYTPQGSLLYQMPLSGNSDPVIMAQAEGYIVKAVPSKNGSCLFACLNNIYLWDNGKIENFMAVDQPIVDFTLTKSGILITTGDVLIASDGKEATLQVQGDMRNLLYEGGRTYLINSDGSIFYSDKF